MRKRKAAGRKLAAKPASHRFSGLKSLNDKAAVLLFIAALIIVIFLLDALADQRFQLGAKKSAAKALSKENVEELVLSKFVIGSKEQDGMGFIVKDTVDPELLEHLATKEYSQVKKELGLDADFAIHFEDENGNLVPMGERACIGSREASIQGIPCS